MLTFPCFKEEPWRARLAASLLRLRTRACDARQRQRTGTVQASRVRPRREAGTIAERPAPAGFIIRGGLITRIESSGED